MAKQPVFLNLTDLHALSEYGPSLNKAATPQQAWIAKKINAVYTKGVWFANHGFEVNIGFGGEFVDEPGFQARNMAESLCEPFVRLARATGGKLHALRGTAYHVGEEGDEDTAVAKSLGIRDVSEAKEFRLGGKLIWHSHHGPKPSPKPSARANALNNAASDIYFDCIERQEPVPDLVIYGHWHQHQIGSWHYTDRKGAARELLVVSSPAWKLKDRYAHKVVPLWRPWIGAVWYLPLQHRIVPQLFGVPKQFLRGKVGWQ